MPQQSAADNIPEWMQLPVINSDADVKHASQLMSQPLQHLDKIEDREFLANWLELIEKHKLEEEPGLVPENNFLDILGRLLCLGLNDRTKAIIKKAVADPASGFEHRILPLPVSGMLTDFFEDKWSITNDDRKFINELFEAAIATDALFYGEQQTKEAFLSQLFVIDFFIGNNDAQTAQRLEQRLSDCLADDVQPENKPYFLQCIAENLSELIPLARCDKHHHKLKILGQFITPESLKWADERTTILRTIDTAAKINDELAVVPGL